MSDVLELTKKLIAIPSCEGNQSALQEVLTVCKNELDGFTIEKFERNGIHSLLAYTANTRPSHFKILLNGHVDVVPGRNENYIPRTEGDALLGVGSLDMKASVACLINVFRNNAKLVNYPLALQIVTDEELGGFDGTKYQVEQGVNADFVIAGEPTNFDIVYKAKGIMWLKISCVGQTAHGAYPWRGLNAVWRMYGFLKDLFEFFPLPVEESWKSTINLSDIYTHNDAFNKIPDSCTIHLDIRIIPEDKDVLLKKVTSILPDGFTLEIITNEPAMLTDVDNQYVQTLKKCTEEVAKSETVLRGANGSSDARHFVKVGYPGIEFGPLGGDIGSDTEWVSIAGLVDYQTILEKFLVSSELLS